MGLDDRDFAFVAQLVRTRAAIVLEPSKAYLVESRLGPLARRHGLDDVGELVHRLRTQPANGLHDETVDAMTTNETSFFRDQHPFTALERVIVPRLLESRTHERTLTIWSGACSSGQEPYSIAMLLRERFARQLEGWNVRIIASDLSAEMLARAAAARYSQLEVNRGLPATMLVRYFERDGAEWRLKDDLRSMVELRAINLVEPWPFVPSVDVMFLRNVLIYFDNDTKREVLGRIHKVLRPEGLLFLGGAETTLNIDDRFERVVLEGATAYRRP